MRLIGMVVSAFLVAVLIAAQLSLASDDDNENWSLGEKALQLQHRLLSLENKLSRRMRNDKLNKLFRLDKRIRDREDDHCESKKFKLCGHHTDQCVHKLLFCDGFSDCDNGFDERHCVLPFHAGDVLEAELISDRCPLKAPELSLVNVDIVNKGTSLAQNMKVRVALDSYHRTPWTGTVLTLSGVYDAGSNFVTFKPATGLNIDLGFVFQLENNEKEFYGYLGSFAHDFSCAKYLIRKI